MAGSWLRGVIGVSLTLCVAGQALAAEGKVTAFRRRIVNQRDAGYCPGV